MGCGKQCARFLLIIFNLIFWLSGAGLIGIGVWLLIDKENTAYLELLDLAADKYDPMLEYAAYIFIGVGVFVFIVGFLGCCGAIQESKGMLIGYTILLFFVLAGEVTAGVLAVLYKTQVEEQFVKEFEHSIQQKYGVGNNKATTDSWDKVQTRLMCCGVQGPSDYQGSQWQQLNIPKVVPQSCCRLSGESTPDNPQYEQCTELDIQNDSIYQKGCATALNEWFQQNSVVVIGIGLGIAVLELFGIVFAICLCRSISTEE